MNVIDASHRFEGQLLRKERAASSRMLRLYADLWRQNKKQIEQIMKDLKAAQAIGVETADLVLARQKAEYFRAQLAQQLVRFSDAAGDELRPLIREAAQFGGEYAKNMAGVALGKGSRVVLPLYGGLPAGAVEQYVSQALPGGPLDATLRAISQEGADKASQALLTGIIDGQDVRTVAKLVEAALGTTLSRALTLTRTETLNAFRRSSLDSYRANSDVVQGWIWSATMDSNTCPECAAMHGTFHGLDEEMDTHPNCRCAEVPVARSWADLGAQFGIDLSELAEAAPEITPGAELFAKFPEQMQRKMLGPGKFELYKAGKLTLDDDPKTGVVFHRRSGGERTIGMRPLRYWRG